jgi:hypothetical protein
MATSVRKENRWKATLQAENDARDKIRRELEALSISRKPRVAVNNVSNLPTKSSVKKWMRDNASEYGSATELAEGANAEFDMPIEWLDDESHWVWELAEAFYYDSDM